MVGIDLLFQGEFLNPGETVTENRRVSYPGQQSKTDTAWRQSSVYRYGYNHPLLVQRVHDVLTTTTFVLNHETWEVEELIVVGLGEMGPIAAGARAVAGDSIDRLYAETDGFRFAALDSQWHQHFVPGGAKYGDVGGFLSLSAPHSVWLADGDEKLRAGLEATWKASGSADELSFHDGDATPVEAVIAHLLK